MSCTDHKPGQMEGDEEKLMRMTGGVPRCEESRGKKREAAGEDESRQKKD